MDRFISSPLRGWRWLLGFLGVIIAGAAIYVFVDWPRAPEPKDALILIFPSLLLIVGLVLAYAGLLASDDRLMKVVRFMQRIA